MKKDDTRMKYNDTPEMVVGDQCKNHPQLYHVIPKSCNCKPKKRTQQKLGKWFGDKKDTP